MQPIYTIGHSSQSITSFIGQLQRHDIEVIADVRSRPYSSRFPHFSAAPLKASLAAAHMRYVFLGQELGARREEAECYVEGQASYDQIAKLPAFAAGIERLLAGAQRYRVALLCAEQDPLTCHRTILVCRELLGRQLQNRVPPEQALSIRHILRSGEIEEQQQADQRLVEEERGGSDQPDLFAQPADFQQLLQRAYASRAARIAWRQDDTPGSASLPSG